ncbi:Phage tail tube protein [Anaerovirgula multivorans]|uniref:Phage tail tube protein n=1 Tax=Anaerovirgula multivorans TaxID=312168 RepID=A0A239KK15_9FIRM|nr:phage tail tube protein [Anaerovirgula multivorans]SNT18716.1 Phage tail tube protein [Anaerovirgula multivorans]
MANKIPGYRVINGTWGEIWLDGDKVSELKGLEAKITLTKEDVTMCGRLAKDTKITGWEGTGTLKLHKVNSRMMIKLGEAVKKGKDLRFTILSKLSDPDTARAQAERVVLKDVSFDDLTLINFEAKALGEVECPFTFTDYDFTDVIQPE